MSEKSRTPLNVTTLVYMALLCAAQIILSRVLVLDLGAYRISLGTIATILAGLWLGPLCGAITGGVADILGCFLRGYYINPFITCSAMLWGILPSLFLARVKTRDKKTKVLFLALSLLTCGLLGSVVLNTTGLVLIGGYHLYAILPGRLLQTAIMVPVYILLTSLLYFSPLTALVTGQKPGSSR